MSNYQTICEACDQDQEPMLRFPTWDNRVIAQPPVLVPVHTGHGNAGWCHQGADRDLRPQEVQDYKENRFCLPDQLSEAGILVEEPEDQAFLAQCWETQNTKPGLE